MSLFEEIFLYLIHTLGGIYVFIAMMRVLLQASRADFYNPVSQFVLKATQPAVGLLGKFIPSWKSFDFAALIWVFIVQLMLSELSALVLGTFIPLGIALVWVLIGTLHMFLTIIYWCMVVLIIVSFIGMIGNKPLHHPILNLLRQLMAPLMQPAQRILPPMSGIDLSPILIFVVITVLQMITYSMARGVNLDIRLVIGI